jgi:hypothetical protein
MAEVLVGGAGPSKQKPPEAATAIKRPYFRTSAAILALPCAALPRQS